MKPLKKWKLEQTYITYEHTIEIYLALQLRILYTIKGITNTYHHLIRHEAYFFVNVLFNDTIVCKQNAHGTHNLAEEKQSNTFVTFYFSLY